MSEVSSEKISETHTFRARILGKLVRTHVSEDPPPSETLVTEHSKHKKKHKKTHSAYMCVGYFFWSSKAAVQAFHAAPATKHICSSLFCGAGRPETSVRTILWEGGGFDTYVSQDLAPSCSL